MKILGISGSPNPVGFTNLLFKKAMEGAAAGGAKIAAVILNELDFDPCRECHGCGEKGECVLTDDMTPLYKKILAADGLIIASPIYFGTVSAQLKMMIDRLGCLWIAKHRLKMRFAGPAGRKGLFICTAGADREEHFECAKKVVKAAFATIGVSYRDELFVGGLDCLSGSCAKRKKAMEKAFRLGAGLASHRLP